MSSTAILIEEDHPMWAKRRCGTEKETRGRARRVESNNNINDMDKTGVSRSSRQRIVISNSGRVLNAVREEAVEVIKTADSRQQTDRQMTRASRTARM